MKFKPGQWVGDYVVEAPSIRSRKGKAVYLVRCRECDAMEEYHQHVLSRPDMMRCTHPLVDGATPCHADPAFQAVSVRRPGGMTFEEIAEVMHLTRERIRQIECEAIAKLRKRAADLKPLVGDERAEATHWLAAIEAMGA